MTFFEEQKKIKEINLSLEKERSTETALEKARKIGAFKINGLILYRKKIYHVSEIMPQRNFLG